MIKKNKKNPIAKFLAEVSKNATRISTDSACCYIFHQPKMPEELKKEKK